MPSWSAFANDEGGYGGLLLAAFSSYLIVSRTSTRGSRRLGKLAAVRMHSHLSLKHRTHKGDDNQKVSKGKRWNIPQARRPRRFGAGVAVGGPAGPALWAHSHPAARAGRVLPHQMDCHGSTGSRLSLSYQLEAGMGTLRAFGAQYRLTWWLNGGFF